VAAPKLTAILLWGLPFGVVVLLGGWALADFLSITRTALAQGFVLTLLLGLALLALGVRFRLTAARRIGFAVAVATYFAAHLVALPLDPGPALGYLTLALTGSETRLLAERFAPLVASSLRPGDRARVNEALGRSLFRVVAVSAIAFLLSYLTADLALAGTVPATSIATALLLSGALVGVVFLLAVWPVLERREA
jgi:uncharacterized membrane protein YhhN